MEFCVVLFLILQATSQNLAFLAPTGAQGVKMYVRVCVCDIPQIIALKGVP